MTLRALHACGVLPLLLVGLLLPGLAVAADVSATTSELARTFREAELALDQGEPRRAASHYRGALREAWYLLGLVEVAEGDLPAARQALDRARNAATVDLGRARVALALVALRLGEQEEPLRELRLTAAEDPRDSTTRELFAAALATTGREEELALVLDELRTLDPEAARRFEAGPPVERAPLPSLGELEGADGAALEDLRRRLGASLLRATRNLVALHRRVGFTRPLDALGAELEALEARFPDAAEPFGAVDLSPDQSIRRVHPPRLDPVALLATEPPALRPVIELFDAEGPAAAEAALRDLLDGEDGAAARSLLGRVLAHRGETAQAEAELLAAAEEGAASAQLFQTLARIAWGRGEVDRDQAVLHLRRAASLGLLDRDLALQLADVELESGHRRAAERQLASLDKRFASVEALLRLAELAWQTRQPKRALEAVERAFREAPNSEEVLLHHARIALDAGVVASAVRSVEPLVRLRPEEAEYQLLLGRVWVERRKMGEATEALLRAVALDPDLVPAFRPLGLALNHESRFEEARGYLERYLDAYPGVPEALAGLAEAEERLGEPERAEELAQRVLAQDPSHARANLVLGMVRSGEGDFAAARAAFEQAVASDPLLAKAHYQLSQACARLRDRECAADALESYERALGGVEATYVPMQTVKGTTLMQREKGGESPTVLQRQEGGGGGQR
jgi:tetratricopeptide (TPR) repeat protein